MESSFASVSSTVLVRSRMHRIAISSSSITTRTLSFVSSFPRSVLYDGKVDGARASK
jgi:hypothetical protein